MQVAWKKIFENEIFEKPDKHPKTVTQQGCHMIIYYHMTTSNERYMWHSAEWRGLGDFASYITEEYLQKICNNSKYPE